MAIPITQPFDFESQLPNFQRDVIDTSTFENASPLKLTSDESSKIGAKYDVGHIVWDTYTKKHYRVECNVVGETETFKLVAQEPLSMTSSEWSELGETYIPQSGEIIVFTDYDDGSGVTRPMIKIGDGVTTPKDLKFGNSSSEIAKKVSHSLTIGPYVYDGSADVVVDIYGEEYEVE